MAGSYDTTPSPHQHHLQGPPPPPHPEDHYNVPHYASYAVQPPLGSDSGSSGYVPLPPGGFSPVANNKEYQSQQHQQHLQQQQQQNQHHLTTLAAAAAAAGAHPTEHWNNNDRVVDTAYDCY